MCSPIRSDGQGPGAGGQWSGVRSHRPDGDFQQSTIGAPVRAPMNLSPLWQFLLTSYGHFLLNLFIFDLDGTLIDSALDLALSVNATRRHMGMPELDHGT